MNSLHPEINEESKSPTDKLYLGNRDFIEKPNSTTNLHRVVASEVGDLENECIYISLGPKNSKNYKLFDALIEVLSGYEKFKVIISFSGDKEAYYHYKNNLKWEKNYNIYFEIFINQKQILANNTF